MDITIEKLVELLNHDLELEYSAAIQYINHSAVMTGAAYGDIIKELKIHTNEEIQHAMILADQIDFLGGKPTVKVGEIHVSQDNDTMLKQDLEGEEDAIQRSKSELSRPKILKNLLWPNNCGIYWQLNRNMPWISNRHWVSSDVLEITCLFKIQCIF